MNVFTMLLTAEEPLLLTSLQGDPNSSVSFSHVPGSVLRGALIERYLRAAPPTNGMAEFRQLFLGGAVRYLNGYLAVASGDSARRGLPVPQSWASPKNETQPVVDRAIPVGDIHDVPSPKPLKNNVCTVDANGISLLDVARHINIHNQRDRPQGRGVTEKATELQRGAVFRYEALAPGQTFQAAILVDDLPKELVDTLRRLLADGLVWLGGSRHAGYGRTRLHGFTEHTVWREVATPAHPTDATLYVTLLSDLIARDAQGQHCGTFPIDTLATQLGVSLILDPTRSFQSQTAYGGFNRTWGLPLPQVAALQAGSVLAFTVSSPPPPDRLMAFEWAGLGERRAEGFGRVAFNWYLPTQPMPVTNAAPWRDTPPTYAPAPNELNMLERRLLRQRLDAHLITLVEHHHIHGEITNAQLSRLRIIARCLLESNNLGGLQTLFLDRLPQRTKNQFDAAKVGKKSQRLLEWLKGLTEHPAEYWQEVLPVTLQGTTAQLDPELIREYNLRLIMAITKQATKETR